MICKALPIKHDNTATEKSANSHETLPIFNPPQKHLVSNNKTGGYSDLTPAQTLEFHHRAKPPETHEGPPAEDGEGQG